MWIETFFFSWKTISRPVVHRSRVDRCGLKQSGGCRRLRAEVFIDPAWIDVD